MGPSVEVTEVRLAAPRAGEVKVRIETTEQALDDLAAGRALRTPLVA
jgi:Zn-dependent alcohol dehydrogenase